MAAAMPSAIQRGTPAYLRANLALFLAGFATFSLLYCVQPLLPAFAKTFGVSPAESSLALSLSTSLLAFAILVAESHSLISEVFFSARRPMICAIRWKKPASWVRRLKSLARRCPNWVRSFSRC